MNITQSSFGEGNSRSRKQNFPSQPRNIHYVVDKSPPLLSSILNLTDDLSIHTLSL